MLTPDGLHPYLGVAHAPRPCSMMPRATVWVKKIPGQLEVGVVERAVVLQERPGLKNPAALTSRVTSACSSAGCRDHQLVAREVGRRSKRSLLVAAHGQLCWLHTSKPGRPARLAHRQIRYLLESVGSGETRCAKANIDSDPLLRAAAAA